MITPMALKEIPRIARQTLADAGVDEPPVRKEVLLARAGLSEETFMPEEWGFKSSHTDLIRGIIDILEKVVYLNGTLLESQKNFVGLHELGHWALPWQRGLLKVCCEWDLHPAIQSEIEEEANLFAASCLFLGNHFTEEARSLPFSHKSLRTLKERYAVSHHASLIEYLKGFAGEAALLVLSWRKKGGVFIRRYLTEGRFPVWIPQGESLPGDHPVSRLYHRVSQGSPASWSGRWPDEGRRPRARAFALDNGFERFVLVRCEG